MSDENKAADLLIGMSQFFKGTMEQLGFDMATFQTLGRLSLKMREVQAIHSGRHEQAVIHLCLTANFDVGHFEYSVVGRVYQREARFRSLAAAEEILDGWIKERGIP